MKKVTVLKRDGKKEDYAPAKIKKVVIAAGLDDDQAETLIKQVNHLVTELNSEEIDSLQIKDFVIEELRKLDDYAANMYMWYEKTKEQ